MKDNPWATDRGETRDQLGRPLQDLRISVTDRCNFRCPYCMPAETFGEKYRFLPREELLIFEEITRLATLFVQLGVRKIRLTGGEPLVRNGLEKLVALLSQIEGIEDLTLTTNGYLLASRAQTLKEAGLHRVTVSLDSLDEEVFKIMNGRGYGPQRTLQGIHRAAEVGLRPLKINTVVQRGINDHCFVDVARHFQGTGHIVRFIEYMDVGNLNGWQWEEVVPAEEIHARIHAVMPLEPVEPNYRGEVASRYRYQDGSGEIGIIASVTQPFCGDCTRARLSTDGKLFTCLFASQGTDLRGPLREGASDGELRELIRNTWNRRFDRYSEIRSLARSTPESETRRVEMYQIGG